MRFGDTDGTYGNLELDVLVSRHDAHPPFVQVLLDELHHERASLAIEVGERFVHQPQRHIREQHAGERHPALLARRQ